MLESIRSPRDIDGLSEKELNDLAGELRAVILDTVAKNGGHLASNLGMVEATLALHRTFRAPEDTILFDVSHQAYTHKLLTGRYGRFSTLRAFGGLSGFTTRGESEYDVLTEGHSGSALSAALGLAEANRLTGKNAYAVAVVGDGSLTNGMVYEALNNCDGKDLNLILLINDNEMSISPNVGGLHRYLSHIRVSRGYFSFKRGFERFLSAIPLVGRGLAVFLKRVKDGFKRLFVKNNIFEDLGLIYLGPVDGHDVKKLSMVLEEAKTKHQPCVVHMITKKGMGYSFAEAEPGRYHSIGSFDPLSGAAERKNEDFSARMGEHLCVCAEKDDRICAITAAMCDGTGLTAFARRFPERFYDVGIAEEHAITFAGGLAAGGRKPVVALYSTFAQRVYDQILHDIAIQKLPMVLLLDRAGLVPGDGVTHQGIFDYSLFSSVPGVAVYSPETYEELELTMDLALAEDKLSVIRYPKGNAPAKREGALWQAEALLEHSANVEEAEVVLVTYGRMAAVAERAAALLAEEYSVGWIKAVQVFPTPHEAVEKLTPRAKLVYYLEEGIASGGFAEKMAARHSGKGGAVTHAVEGFVPHGELADLNRLCAFTPEQVAERVRKALSAL
ncbi:MAG: 1-deoxy-D-xylulose-5-phosphate synthase [Clostridia bacterium]|nr:1-deoxy-D-xylulose-5-phosphate synthase [Clostridia bacterium]